MPLISETWLKNNTATDKLTIDIDSGDGLKLITKHRPKRKNRPSITGGGVMIVYDTHKISPKEHLLKKNSFEIVAATGKMANIKC